MIRLEAVTTCVNYSDFLAETAKHNRHLFTKWLVVTRPEDEDTIKVCRTHNLECITTTDFAREGEAFNFNKGRAISLGISQMSSDAWLCHIDADVVLPRDTLRYLEIAKIEPGFLYGLDRVRVTSWEEWKKIEAKDSIYFQHVHHLVVVPPEERLGHRIVRDGFGYVPIGYFQLWHSTDGMSGNWRYKDYPFTNSTAAHSDIKFALQWPREKRSLIPELFCWHLESEKSPNGHNWKGRQSKKFGPSSTKAGYEKAP